MATKIKNKEKKKAPKRPNTELCLGITILVIIVVLISMYFAWPEDENNSSQQNSSDISQSEPADKYSHKQNGSKLTESGEIDKSDSESFRVIMADGGEFVMEVYPHVAPETVKNFTKLVDEKFYDGLTFHRVIDGFMAQGGAYDPVNQMNNPADDIIGEFSSNGFDNKLSHTRGVVSMARATDPNSASTQFFICYDDASFLDGDYAAFGMVTEGMEVVDSFLSAGTDENDVPLKEVKIKTIEKIN